MLGSDSMKSMFHVCSSLESLDLTGFDTTKVTNMVEMFSRCGKLTEITVSPEWKTAASSASMFDRCGPTT